VQVVLAGDKGTEEDVAATLLRHEGAYVAVEDLP
jgi:hypothetical protein